MRVCFAVLHYDPRVAGPNIHDYLDRVAIHRELPAQLAARGHEVHVVHLYPRAADVAVDGARHHFVQEHPIGRGLAAVMGGINRRDPMVYRPALRAVQLIHDLRPDVVHFHGLTLTWNLLLLVSRLDRRVPLVVHYHGGAPARNPVARIVQRSVARRGSRFLFTTTEHARPFVEDLDLDRLRIVEYPETSTTFRFRPRSDARQVTGMLGNPVFLWTGRLHPVKDPLTALRGFERILAERPEAQLYLYYLTDELLATMRAYVSSRPSLPLHVHFRGLISNPELEAAYNSADFFLQASLREIMGCAALEAMATGTIPVVTDIPSFRAMTDGGRFGILFPRGDDAALARGVLALSPDLRSLSAGVLKRFHDALSYPALGAQLDRIYSELTLPLAPA